MASTCALYVLKSPEPSSATTSLAEPAGGGVVFVRNVQSLFPRNPLKLPSPSVNTPEINLHVISLVVLQQVVVRIDRRHIVVNHDWIEMEGVG